MFEILEKELQGYTFIDLFAGIGGFRIALESLGARCVFSSEIDSNAAETYRNNFGEYPTGDITQVNEADVPNHDILCAGFPCQAFSAGGKKLGFADARGTLFFDVARIIKAKHPKVVLLENVMYLVEHDEGRTMAVIKSTLEELGYSFSYKVLNSAHYGVPQQRKRTYIVCFRNDLEIASFTFPYPLALTRCVKDILLDEEVVPNNLYRVRDVYPPNRKPKEKPDEVILFGFFNQGRQGERVYKTNGVSITLETGNKGVYLISNEGESPIRMRKLHERECARLMGFPDTFILHPTPQVAYHQIGNSVVVDVIQHIATAIARELKGESVDLFLV